MAGFNGLEKQTVSINLAEGVNNKIDEKIAGLGQNSVVTDCRFDKDGRLVKRKGLNQYQNNVSYDVNQQAIAPAFGASATGRSKVMAHEDQLLLENNGGLYSQKTVNNQWEFIGNRLNCEVDATKIDANMVFVDSLNRNNYTFLIGANVNNVTTGASNFQSFCYVVENATGNVISKMVLNSGASSVALKLISFVSKIFVLYVDSATGQAYNQEIQFPIGTLGARITLAGVGVTPGPTPAYVCLTYTNGGNQGEAAIVSLNGLAFVVANTGALGTPPVFYVPTPWTGTVLDVICFPTINPNRVYFLFTQEFSVANSQQTKSLFVGAWNITPNNWNSGWGPVTLQTQSNYVLQLGEWIHGAFVQDPLDPAQMYIFYDYVDVNYGINGKCFGNTNFPVNGYSTAAQTRSSWDVILRYNKIQINNGTGLVTPTNPVGYGYFLCGKPVVDANRQTFYLILQTFSPLQSSIVGIDFLHGKQTYIGTELAKPNYFFFKTLYGKATTTLNAGVTASTTPYPSYRYAPASVNSSGNNQWQLINNSYLVTINLDVEYSAKNQYFAKTTHLTGGMLWGYDGDSIAEHNFLFTPEEFELSTGNPSITTTVITQGTASVAEVWSYTFPIGALVLTNPTTTAVNYLTFNSPTAGYFIYFIKPTGGVAPTVAGRTGIRVDITDYDSSAEVAYKTMVALMNSTAPVALLQVLSTGSGVNAPSTSTLKISNASNGVATDAATVGMVNSGSLSAGSYQYSIVWAWKDRNGQIYRSAPSVPKTIAASASGAVGLLVCAPPLTNKYLNKTIALAGSNPFENIFAEIYRTQANGTTFNLVGSVSWAMNSRLIYTDKASDAAISTNALLYTTGGVLENYSIPACKNISFYKNRLCISGLDDQSLVYYSKTNVINEPVNFSPVLYLTMNQDQNEVTGHASLDDKLIVFKNEQTYLVGGDGANDLGVNSTFQTPFLLASDVGCINSNSIVLFPGGLLFKSTKGIYRLGRDLQVEYIGAPVEDFNNNKISGGQLLKSLNEVRFTHQDTDKALVYNYYFNRWDYFSRHQSDSCCIWQGKWTRCGVAGDAWTEGNGFFDLDFASQQQSYSMIIETVWLKVKNIQDFTRIYEIEFLNEYKSPHTLSFLVWYDYDPIVGNGVPYTFDAYNVIGLGANTPAGNKTYQFKLNLSKQKCQSIKLKIIENPSGIGSQESLIINQMDLLVGVKSGLNKVKPDKSI